MRKSHGHVDGNNRIGFAAAATFLVVSRVRLAASEQESYDAVIRVEEGRLSEQELASCIRRSELIRACETRAWENGPSVGVSRQIRLVEEAETCPQEIDDPFECDIGNDPLHLIQPPNCLALLEGKRQLRSSRPSG